MEFRLCNCCSDLSTDLICGTSQVLKTVMDSLSLQLQLFKMKSMFSISKTKELCLKSGLSISVIRLYIKEEIHLFYTWSSFYWQSRRPHTLQKHPAVWQEAAFLSLNIYNHDSVVAFGRVDGMKDALKGWFVRGLVFLIPPCSFHCHDKEPRRKGCSRTHEVNYSIALWGSSPSAGGVNGMIHEKRGVV